MRPVCEVQWLPARLGIGACNCNFDTFHPLDVWTTTWKAWLKPWARVEMLERVQPGDRPQSRTSGWRKEIGNPDGKRPARAGPGAFTVRSLSIGRSGDRTAPMRAPVTSRSVRSRVYLDHLGMILLLLFGARLQIAARCVVICGGASQNLRMLLVNRRSFLRTMRAVDSVVPMAHIPHSRSDFRRQLYDQIRIQCIQ
jgi:hypothetical protein